MACDERHTCSAFSEIGVHRLDARVGVRGDDSGALLRLLAQHGSSKNRPLPLVTGTFHSTRADFSFFVRCFVCAGYRAATAAETTLDGNFQNCTFARSGDFWLRITFASSGIRSGLPQIALDGSVPRGCAQHPGSLTDSDGVVLEVDDRAEPYLCEASRPALEKQNYLTGVARGRGDCRGYPSFVDDSPAAISSLDAGVVYQRRTHLRCAATVALCNFSVVRFCVCGPGVRFIYPLEFCTEEGSVGAGDRGRHRCCGVRLVAVVGLFKDADLCGLRLLAQQPEFFSDALRDFVDSGVCYFCVVPVGMGYEGI